MSEENPKNGVFSPSPQKSNESLPGVPAHTNSLPPSSADSVTLTKIAALMPSPPPRHTVTTLLRQNLMVEEKEKQTKKKIEGIVAGKFDFDFESWRQKKNLEEKKRRDALEAKRILKAKLAYHKAIEATKNIQEVKKEQANTFRNKTQKMREEASQEKEAEMERRRSLASDIQEDLQNCKKTIEDLYLERRRQANEFKEKTAKLQEVKRQKEAQDLISKKERIQQIQASKMALRVANSHGLHSTASFMGAIGSPDAEIKLKLAKEKEQAELEEKRRKVRESKEERERKLLELRDKLDTHAAHTNSKKLWKEQFKQLPEFQDLVVDPAEDGEMSQLTEELAKFTANSRQKRELISVVAPKPQIRRRSRVDLQMKQCFGQFIQIPNRSRTKLSSSADDRPDTPKSSRSRSTQLKKSRASLHIPVKMKSSTSHHTLSKIDIGLSLLRSRLSSEKL